MNKAKDEPHAEQTVNKSRRQTSQALATVFTSYLVSGCSASSGAQSIAPASSEKLIENGAAPKNVLTTAPASVRLVPDSRPPTPVWAYGGLVPGEMLTVRHGEVVDVSFENSLPEPSTVHWHGIRLPNAMDGVPELTQAPVSPGKQYRYTYRAPDAGTYW